MIRTQRIFKKQSNIINHGVLNATNEKPTNATFKAKETMDTNEETTRTTRQESEAVSNESKLVENKETKRQKETEITVQNMENETVTFVRY